MIDMDNLPDPHEDVDEGYDDQEAVKGIPERVNFERIGKTMGALKERTEREHREAHRAQQEFDPTGLSEYGEADEPDEDYPSPDDLLGLGDEDGQPA